MRLYRIENVCQQIVASYDRKSLVYRRKDRSPMKKLDFYFIIKISHIENK